MKISKAIMASAAALLLSGSAIAYAYETTDKAGNTVSVEFFSKGIVHVRVSPDGNFPESLLQRYGLLFDSETAIRRQEETPEGVSLGFGGVTVEIDRAAGTMTFNGRKISYSAPGSDLCTTLAGVINDKFSGLHVASNGGIIGDDDGSISEKDRAESGDPQKSCVVSISLNDGERFYGGGSTSREHIQHRGELLRMHTTYQHTEIPMPFLVSSEGWGIFNNTTRKNFFDIGCTDPSTLNIYTPSEGADFFVFVGENMADVIDCYTKLTGRPYLLPKWAYGLCFGPNMREDQWDILSDAVNFRNCDVPCDVFWLEPQWMEKRYDFSTEKKFNSQLFSPEPYWLEKQYPKQLYNRLFIGKLRNMGFHLGLWLCEEYDLSLVEEDAIAARTGAPQSGEEHWMDHLKPFMDLGIEGFKLDPARTIDEHTFRKYYNGYTDRDMHNLNQVLLPKQMRELSQGHTGKRSWHHYCGGWSGTQHWTASTSGDNGGGKTALFDQINLGMSGFMNTSCDVMSVPAELEMQSLHFGMFLPWCQINSWFSMMHPFYYNDFQQTLYRNCVKLRYTLMPYIYSAALEGALTGMPMVRSMPLCFPDDRNVDDMWNQYMFGGSLLVGIFTDEVYLPEGQWIDAWSQKVIESRGETFKLGYPEDRAGLLYIKSGAIIPCQKDVKYIGTEPLSHFILKVYPDGESSYTLLDSDAESYGYENDLVSFTRFDCSKSGKSVKFTINPTEGTFENMPAVRTYDLEIFCPEGKPSKVSVDGKKTEWSYSADGKVLLTLAGVNVSDTVSVDIKL